MLQLLVVNACVEQKKAFWTNLESYENIKCLEPILIYCIIHQKVLCGKYLHLLCVIRPIVSKVNCISSSGPNHCLFCELLSKIEAEYPDLPYESLNSWLISNKSSMMFLAQGPARIFSWQEPPSTTIIEHWITLEISFCWILHGIS